MIYALSLFLVIQVLDVISTYLGLKSGARESNPFIRWILDKFGGWVAVIVKLSISGFAGYYFFINGYELLLWGFNVLIGFVVINNFRIWKKIR